MGEIVYCLCPHNVVVIAASAPILVVVKDLEHNIQAVEGWQQTAAAAAVNSKSPQRRSM